MYDKVPLAFVAQGGRLIDSYCMRGFATHSKGVLSLVLKMEALQPTKEVASDTVPAELSS